ncbi:MAG TPA: hypothetical protein VI935_00210 [Thermodesulfobacteriota bacterium]|nr:hypothetical protein [Thermodesulfobacteriota bacterium]
MNSILILSAFIIAIILLFLLDRKSKTEKPEVERIYNEIFKIFNKIKWGMAMGELREAFKDKEFVTSEESGEVMGTGFMDKLDGQDIFISFYFPKGGKDTLIRADYYLIGMPTSKVNPLFSKFIEKYGTPLPQNSSDQKSSSWDLGNSLLTLEPTDGEALQIQLWSKEFYNKIDKM